MLDSLIPDDYRKNYNKYSTNLISKKNNNLENKTDKKESLNFASMVNSKGETLFDGDIDLFLKKLEGLESDLLERPNLSSVAKYKEAVGDFLSKLSKNYIHFKFPRWKKTEAKIWEIKDKKLEELGKGIISKQLKGMMVLDKLQEIKGLIIDLKIGKVR